MAHFHEDAGFEVAAALRRGGSPGQIGRPSEIGSHTPLKTTIFIRRDPPNGGDGRLLRNDWHPAQSTLLRNLYSCVIRYWVWNA